MKKTVAILQSNYIPWKGNFHMMYLVDEYVLYDDVQFTRRDWRNRNRIKTPNGLQWLTIPVKAVKNHQSDDNGQRICDTEIQDPFWAEQHWRKLETNYKMAPCWKEHADPIKQLYEVAAREVYLSKANYIFLTGLMQMLGFSTKITWSMDYNAHGHKTDRLLDILCQTGATDYISGPAARQYIEREKFAKANIELHWMEYGPYPEYPQLYPPFEHGVSIIDMLFSLGNRTAASIWGDGSIW